MQRPRLPVWVAARWPNRRPLRRAARWDGLFPIDLEEPRAARGAGGRRCASCAGVGAAPFEIVVENGPGTDPAPWEAAGATWCLTGLEQTVSEAEVRAAIEA